MQKSENNGGNNPESIARIHTKLQQLLKLYDNAQKENERHKKTIDSLQKKQVEFQENITNMEQQNLVLKASLSSMTPDDKKDLEQKLTHYMRSIDKCISLLSK
jgi:chromosome segregation ATPase